MINNSISHVGGERGRHLSRVPVGNCPVCGVLVVRWSLIKGPDQKSYIAAMRFRMDEGRALWLRRRMRSVQTV